MDHTKNRCTITALFLAILLIGTPSFADQVKIYFDGAGSEPYQDVEWYAPEISTEALTLDDFHGKKFQELNMVGQSLKKRIDDVRRDNIDNTQLALGIRQMAAGGLATTAMYPAFLNASELRTVGNLKPSDIKNQELVWNEMIFEVESVENSPNYTGRFTINAQKKITFRNPISGGEDIIIFANYEWIIHTTEGGLIYARIPDPKMPDGSSMQGFNHKYHARSPHIKVVSFKINGAEVPYFDSQTGMLYKVGNVKHPSPSDCLDIDTVRPLIGSGTIEMRPRDIRFCAGSCSGYLITATNT